MLNLPCTITAASLRCGNGIREQNTGVLFTLATFPETRSEGSLLFFYHSKVNTYRRFSLR